MKVRLIVSEKRYKEVEEELKTKGIEVDENADLEVRERNVDLDYLIVKKQHYFKRLKTSEIILIESFARDIVVHTIEDQYKVNERLKQLELLLDARYFIRINKSMIVNKDKIKQIIPTFASKFVLVLLNDQRVEVTRSYYYIFKEELGF